MADACIPVIYLGIAGIVKRGKQMIDTCYEWSTVGGH